MDIHDIMLNRPLTGKESIAYREIRLEALRLFPDSFGSDYDEQSALPVLFLEGCLNDPACPHTVYGTFANALSPDTPPRLIAICAITRNTAKKSRHLAELIQLFVLPEFQGKGIARSLVGAALYSTFDGPEIELVELSVNIANKGAIHLYHQLGFKETGILPAQFKGANGYVDLQFMMVSREDFLRDL